MPHCSNSRGSSSALRGAVDLLDGLGTAGGELIVAFVAAPLPLVEVPAQQRRVAGGHGDPPRPPGCRSRPWLPAPPRPARRWPRIHSMAATSPGLLRRRYASPSRVGWPWKLSALLGMAASGYQRLPRTSKPVRINAGSLSHSATPLLGQPAHPVGRRQRQQHPRLVVDLEHRVHARAEQVAQKDELGNKRQGQRQTDHDAWRRDRETR